MLINIGIIHAWKQILNLNSTYTGNWTYDVLPVKRKY